MRKISLLLLGITVFSVACTVKNPIDESKSGSSEEPIVTESSERQGNESSEESVTDEGDFSESDTEEPEKSTFMDRSLEEVLYKINGIDHTVPRYVVGEALNRPDETVSLGRNPKEELRYLYYPLSDSQNVPMSKVQLSSDRVYQNEMNRDLKRGFRLNEQAVTIPLVRGAENRVYVTKNGQSVIIDGGTYYLKVTEIWSYTSHPEVIRDNTYDPNTGEIKIPVNQEYSAGVPLSVIALDLDPEDEYTELFAREGENVIVLRYDGEKLIQLGCMILRNPVLELDEGFRIPRYRESGVLYEKYTCFAFPLDSDFTFYVPLSEIREDCLVQPSVEGSACFGCESMERDKYFNTYMRDSLHTWLVKPLTLNTKPDGSGEPVEIQPQQIEFSAVYFDEVPASLEDRTKDGFLTCDALEIRGYEDETIGWIRTSDLSADSFYGRHGSSTDDSLANKDSAGYETISEKPGI